MKKSPSVVQQVPCYSMTFELHDHRVPPPKYEKFLNTTVESVKKSLEDHYQKSLEQLAKQQAQRIPPADNPLTEEARSLLREPLLISLHGSYHFQEYGHRDLERNKRVYHQELWLDKALKFPLPCGREKIAEFISLLPGGLDNHFPSRKGKIPSAIALSPQNGLNTSSILKDFEFTLTLHSPLKNSLNVDISLVSYGLDINLDAKLEFIPAIRLRAKQLMGKLTFPQHLVTDLARLVVKYYAVEDIRHESSYTI